MKNNFKWGIIGLGNIAETFAKAVETVNGAEVWAVASRSLSKAKDFARKYKAPYFYGSYEEIVNNKELDAIYVATLHPYHMENSMMCLENKIPVLCEKPLGMNMKQILKMMEVAKENNTFLMEALWTRFLPTTLKTKEIMDAGKLGDIKIVDVNFCFKAETDPNNRCFNKAHGGGTTLDIGIYPLFLALYLFGKPKTMNAIGTIGTTGVDETCSVCMHYDNGVIVNMYYSFMVDNPMEAKIIGTEGAIKLHHYWFGAQGMDIIKVHDVVDTIKYNYRSNGFEYEIEEVMKCLKEGKTQSDIWGFEQSIELMELMDEVRIHIGLEYDADNEEY